MQRTAVAVHAALQEPIERLKTRSQFQAVLAGSVISKTPHFALHAVHSLNTALREAVESSANGTTAPLHFPHPHALPRLILGAMVPKRLAKRAVTRNAIKRQIYVVSTEFKQRLPQVAHVVRLRSGFPKTQFASATSTALKTAVRTELVRLFTTAQIKSAL